jgi:hypothetical protein
MGVVGSTDPCPQPFQFHEIAKRVEGALFPISGVPAHFYAVSVPFTSDRQCQPSATIIKSLWFNGFLKFL